MGVFFSSCAPNLNSKTLFLKKNYKDFDINNSTQTSRIMKNKREEDTKNSISIYEEYWNCSKFDEIDPKSNINDISEKHIQPKNMPRYDFSTLKKQVFLNEVLPEGATNISVVLMHSILLERIDNEQIYLPLGTVLSVVSRKDNWLYVRTVDGQHCYVDHEACVPLGIFSLPPYENDGFSSKNINNGSIATPENVNSVDNLSDFKLRCSERDFDLLYLRLTRNKNGSKKQANNTIQLSSPNNITADAKTVILIIKTDYTSNAQNTLNVKKGDIVFFIHCCVKGWFWVRNKNDVEGFIPAITAGYWCT